jgi:putative transposase
MNRIVGNMPYLKLTQYITYKANWEGIAVIKINERGTSHSCSRCGAKGTRPYQGLFKCKSCGYQANADFNGVSNIHKRSLDYMSNDGVLLEPKTPKRCKHED